METILKTDCKDEANVVANTAKKMSLDEQENLAAFMSGIQYAIMLNLPNKRTEQNGAVKG